MTCACTLASRVLGSSPASMVAWGLPVMVTQEETVGIEVIVRDHSSL
jgi:hypothetical protein